MAEHLPQFIALKSITNQKYLVYKDQSTTELPHLLQCSGEDVHSQYARFKVEKDENLPNLVHIKSTYNDKYWSTPSQGSSWIVAGANQKQENQDHWSCTLFQPVVLQQPGPYCNGVYQFRHVQLKNLIEPKAGKDFVNSLAAEKGNPIDSNTSFIVEKLPG